MMSFGMEISSTFYSWFSRMFVACLPYHVMLRVFDIFLNEGKKILFKIGLAILKASSTQLLSTTDKAHFKKCLHDAAAQLYDSDYLIKLAFSFQFSHHHSDKLDIVHHHMIHHVKEPNMPIYYRPKITQSSNIIEDEQFEILWSWLPHRVCILDPHLQFSSAIHGFNLNTLLHNCEDVEPSLMLIKTEYGSIFGAFLSDAWVKSDGKPSYHGSRQTFLWSIKPQAHHWTGTGKNDFFMMAGRDFLCVGGGGAGHGIWMNNELQGRSTSCSTFGNEALEPHAEFFQCVAVEVFALR